MPEEQPRITGPGGCPENAAPAGRAGRPRRAGPDAADLPRKGHQMAAVMTVDEAVAAFAAQCRPGEAALVLITVSEGLSLAVASEQAAHSAARAAAEEDNPDLLAVAVIGADQTVTEYALAGGTANGWAFDPATETWWAKTGPQTWTQVKGTLDSPPSSRPQHQGDPALPVRARRAAT